MHLSLALSLSLTHTHTHTGPAEVRYTDDVWISGQLARWGVQRLVVPLDSATNTHTHTASPNVHSAREEGGAGVGLSLEYMFGSVWRQVGSQANALKGHPHRAARNRATALFFRDYWT